MRWERPSPSGDSGAPARGASECAPKARRRERGAPDPPFRVLAGNPPTSKARPPLWGPGGGSPEHSSWNRPPPQSPEHSPGNRPPLVKPGAPLGETGHPQPPAPHRVPSGRPTGCPLGAPPYAPLSFGACVRAGSGGGTRPRSAPCCTLFPARSRATKPVPLTRPDGRQSPSRSPASPVPPPGTPPGAPQGALWAPHRVPSGRPTGCPLGAPPD